MGFVRTVVKIGIVTLVAAALAGGGGVLAAQASTSVPHSTDSMFGGGLSYEN